MHSSIGNVEPSKDLLDWMNEKPADRKKRILTVCAKCFYRRATAKPEALLSGGACEYWDIVGKARPCSPMHCKDSGVFRKGNRSDKFDPYYGVYKREKDESRKNRRKHKNDDGFAEDIQD